MVEQNWFPCVPKLLSVHGRVIESWPINFTEFSLKWECNTLRWTTFITRNNLKQLWNQTKNELLFTKEEKDWRNQLAKMFSSSCIESVMENMTWSILHFLNQVVSTPNLLVLPQVLELLEVSKTSFDRNGNYTSIKEGYFNIRLWLREIPQSEISQEKISCSNVTLSLDIHMRKSQLRRKRRWAVLKQSYIAIYDTPQDPTPVAVILFDGSFHCERRDICFFRSTSIVIKNHTFLLDLQTGNKHHISLWNDLIMETRERCEYSRFHRDGSFAPVRRPKSLNTRVKWFIDAHDTFEAMYNALNEAKHEILIADWWFSPEIYLLRPPSKHPESKLTTLLKKKADEGVQIYVLLFKEVKIALHLNSSHAEKQLEALSSNIHVLRDPDFTFKQMGFWSHHEKLIIVDQHIAFIGGLDLCFGRYDTSKHILTDEKDPRFFPGKDYSNDRIKDTTEVHKPDVDQLDRDKSVRMPWHDVHCCIQGVPARDLARHYVQRWNYSIASRRHRDKKVPLLVPEALVPDRNLKVSTISRLKSKSISSPSAETSRGFSSLATAVFMRIHTIADYTLSHTISPKKSDTALPDYYTCECQIVRSISQWSGGCPTERSIQHAYLRLIGEAKHLIFIENQFFVSGLNGDPHLRNRIADALVTRILRAAANNEAFRVIVFLPLFPAFAGRPDEHEATSLRGVMHWQYRTICRGEHSIYERLFSELENPFEYIAFFGLRTHDVNSSNVPVSELIYIHSKTMIVDDCKVIIGSANINERSMSGHRDSEMAVVIEDMEFVPGTLNGEKVPVGKFAHSYRMKLFEEHFGAVPGTERYTELEDPVIEKTWFEMQEQAIKNTRIYERVFGCIPNDDVLEFSDLDKNPDELHEQRKKEDLLYNQESESLQKDQENQEMPDSPEKPHSPLRNQDLQDSTQDWSQESIIELCDLELEMPKAKLLPNENILLSNSKILKSERHLRNTSNLHDQEITQSRRNELMEIQGHVVCFPLNFLSKENLKPDYFPTALLT